MKSPILPALAALLFASTLSATEVRLEGGMVVIHDFVAPSRAAVEKETGQILTIAPSTSTKGLLSLAAGNCDIAVIAVPLDLLIAEANKEGKALSTSDFSLTVVKEERIVFITHPSNPVAKLDHAQVQGIYSGRITNWKDVGGPDLPIVVFTDQTGSGTSSLLRALVLGGAPLGGKTSELSNLKLVANSVAAARGAIGAVSSGFVDSAQHKTLETQVLTRPFGFVTKGPPTDAVRQVIEAYRKRAR